MSSLLPVCLSRQAAAYNLLMITGAVMQYGWEGNRRSGVTLAMRPRLKCFIHLRTEALSKGDKYHISMQVWVAGKTVWSLINTWYIKAL